MNKDEDYGCLFIHWALGSLVLIGLTASEYSGAGIVIALPIAAINFILTALCNTEDKSESILKHKKSYKLLEFLIIWFTILQHLIAAATCARVTSATLDYMSKGHFRDLIFGLGQSHSLGEPWPDVIGITIIIVATVLFMLGLEQSVAFTIILTLGVTTSFIFFAVVGGCHTNIKFWNWTQDLVSCNVECMFTTAALCSFAFIDHFPNIFQRYGPTKYFCFTLLSLLSYFSIGLVFTLMSDYRELAGIAIPLVKVFEVRDVDWARLVMATCTISVTCLCLTEIFPAIHRYVVCLARREWKILIPSLLYTNPITGSPILAIFAAGSLASILAFACPLFHLVRILNVCLLLRCAVQSAKTLYTIYAPEYFQEDCSVYHTSIQYSKLSQESRLKSTELSTKRIKTLFNVLPRFLRHDSTLGVARPKIRKDPTANKEDKEYLLLGDCSANLDTIHADNSDSESDVHEESLTYSDGEESSSSTDIDVVVQEYKERIQVAALNNFTNKRKPNLLTSNVVLGCTILTVTSSTLLTKGLLTNSPNFIWPNLMIIVTSLIIIVLMPKNLMEHSNRLLPVSVLPWVAVLSLGTNVILATTLMSDVWPGLVFWLFAGLFLFFRCDCCNCEGLYSPDNERLKLQHSFPSPTCYKDKHIDTVFITR